MYNCNISIVYCNCLFRLYEILNYHNLGIIREIITVWIDYPVNDNKDILLLVL